MNNLRIYKIIKQLYELIGHLCLNISQKWNFILIRVLYSILLSPLKDTSIENCNGLIMLNGKISLLYLWEMLTLPIRNLDITNNWSRLHLCHNSCKVKQTPFIKTLKS